MCLRLLETRCPAPVRALPAAILLAATLSAVGCKGISGGPGPPDAAFDLDTRNCSTQVRYCTCYCAIRCGETCIQRVCNDPCPRDGDDDEDRFPEERLPDGTSRDTRRRPDVVPVPETGIDAAADARMRDAGGSDATRDTLPDTEPSESDAPDVGAPDDLDARGTD